MEQNASGTKECKLKRTEWEIQRQWIEPNCIRIVGVILDSKTEKSEKWKTKREIEKEIRN
jgi:hypothetical protein